MYRAISNSWATENNATFARNSGELRPQKHKILPALQPKGIRIYIAYDHSHRVKSGVTGNLHQSSLICLEMYSLSTYSMTGSEAFMYLVISF